MRGIGYPITELCVVVATNIAHAQTLNSESILTEPSASRVDSLAAGLSFMLLANVGQRGIGFIRNLSFCRFLDEGSLGLWALVSSFFLLVAPLAVLGLPGTFGTLVESYRARGQLRTFLHRVFIACFIGSATTTVILLVGHRELGSVVLGVEVSFVTMLLITLTLASVIAFNTVTELLNGLRRGKTVSAMHSLNSISFTVLSMVGLSLWADWRVIVIAFGLASIIGLFPARKSRGMVDREYHDSRSFLSHSEMWRRVIPFAASIWCMNLLSNLFDIVDRYMLLHWAETSERGAELVGQFHSARVLPVLLTSLTMMLSSLFLPYLSADWETGAKSKVNKSLQLTFKATTYFFYFLSVGSLIVAPFVFGTLLEGRYQVGLSIIPLALCHCCIAAMTIFLQNYFWCAERGRIVGFIAAIGLLVNIGLNYCWVPSYGVAGAMSGTLVSGVVVLLFTLLALRLHSVKLDRGVIWIGLLPLFVLGGSLVAMFFGALAFFITSRTNTLLSREEKHALDNSIVPQLRKLGLPIRSIWYNPT